jgi:hypothetical protein
MRRDAGIGVVCTSDDTDIRISYQDRGDQEAG